MLYRHTQPLFLSAYTDDRLAGPRLMVRPLDTDAPDHLMRFAVWAALDLRSTRADPGVVVLDPQVPPPPIGIPKLFLEMSADGEGWVTQSEITPREKPYLITVTYMLRFVRVRLEGNGVASRGFSLLLANAPFQLEGGSPIVGPTPNSPKVP